LDVIPFQLQLMPEDSPRPVQFTGGDVTLRFCPMAYLQ